MKTLNYSPRIPTALDYETAIARIAAEKVALETTISDIKEILAQKDFNESFQLILIRRLLK